MVTLSTGTDTLYTMKVVEHKTGLTHHTIRVWERRYGAIEPMRTDSNRRMYTDEDIAKLQLLKMLTDIGHPIRNIANMSIEDLSQMMITEQNSLPPAILSAPPLDGHFNLETELDQAMQYVYDMQTSHLEYQMRQIYSRAGLDELIDHFVVPLLQAIGEAWMNGDLKVANEHLATAVIRNYIQNLMTSSQVKPIKSKMIFTTLPGHTHELGSLMAATIAASMAVQPLYLGPNTPIDEMVRLVWEDPTLSAVVISVILPEQTDVSYEMIRELRRKLDSEKRVIIGGLPMARFADDLKNQQVDYVKNFMEFKNILISV